MRQKWRIYGLFNTNPVASRVSLLTVNPAQQGTAQFLSTNPPGYLNQLVLRFSLLARAPDLTQDQRNLLQQNLVVSSNVKHWLMQVRQDAKQLVHMNDAQLSSPKALSLIDDMARQASYAYIGQTDPSVLSQRGALWMYNYLPYLATFEGLQLARVPDHL